MKFLRKAARLIPLMLLVVAVFAVVGGVVAQDGTKVLVTGRQMSSSDIETLDPSLAEGVPAVQVISELFVELNRINEETSAIGPGMAESVDVSEDGTVYTFHLKQDVAWVHYNAETGQVEQVMDESGSPRYVTAADFEYGMTRTLDPVLAGPYSYVLRPWIVGGPEFNDDVEADDAARQAHIDALGINAVDDFTLEVTVNQASAVTPYIFGLWITVAQPSWLIDEQADFWINPENIQTYGPFTVKEWVRGDGGSMTLIKNPFWVGNDSVPLPALDEVQFRFLDEETQLTEFEAGNLDVAEAPAAALDRIRADQTLSSEYFVGPGTCTYYYGFNVEQAPFDDVRARRAFSMAIDRQAIVDNVTGGGEIPASLFALPSLNAAPSSELFPDIGIHSDPEGAVALWNEYLTETGQDGASMQITLFHNDSSLHASIAQAVQQMWNETLGVNVQIATADFATYLDTRGNYQVYRAGWCFDYPDSHNYYYDAGWHSDLLPENDTHWSNPAYDDLVDQAFVAPTVEERRDLYAQADDILVNQDAAIAPIYFYVTDDMTQPNVTRTHSLITREYYEKWDISS